ncbi:MAG: hypothetical protein IH849_11645 [Acidobacteria bacterium]|nr:hypothetical protein [Acidobacteriota bacterium]
MTAAAILAETERRGIRLRTDGSMIDCRPKKAICPELLEAIRERKPELISHLQQSASRPIGCARPPEPHRRCPSCGGGLQRDDADNSPCFTCRWSREHLWPQGPQ